MRRLTGVALGAGYFAPFQYEAAASAAIAIMISYEVDGRQYVATIAGLNLVAFALRD